MNQSQIQTQKLEWIRRRQHEAAQQWRHDVKVDLAFAMLMLCAAGVLILIGSR